MQPLPLWQKAAAGLTAGGLGALVGSPADLSLIRMQSDSTLPAAQRRNYKGVGDALIRIIREDGVGGLFRGAGPTVVRAMSLNMGMLASNDQASLLCPWRPLPLLFRYFVEPGMNQDDTLRPSAFLRCPQCLGAATSKHCLSG